MGEHTRVTDHDTNRVSHTFAVLWKALQRVQIHSTRAVSSPAGISHARLPIWCKIDNLGKPNEMRWSKLPMPNSKITAAVLYSSSLIFTWCQPAQVHHLPLTQICGCPWLMPLCRLPLAPGAARCSWPPAAWQLSFGWPPGRKLHSEYRCFHLGCATAGTLVQIFSKYTYSFLSNVKILLQMS